MVCSFLFFLVLGGGGEEGGAYSFVARLSHLAYPIPALFRRLWPPSISEDSDRFLSILSSTKLFRVTRLIGRGGGGLRYGHMYEACVSPYAQFSQKEQLLLFFFFVLSCFPLPFFFCFVFLFSFYFLSGGSSGRDRGDSGTDSCTRRASTRSPSFPKRRSNANTRSYRWPRRLR